MWITLKFTSTYWFPLPYKGHCFIERGKCLGKKKKSQNKGQVCKTETKYWSVQKNEHKTSWNDGKPDDRVPE